MRNTHALALAAALIVTACKPAAAPLSPADEEAIRSAITVFAAAANANDAAAMAAVYASDATIHPNGMAAAVGSAAINKLWTDMAGMMRLTKFEPTVTRIAGQGDVAYVTGTYHLEATTADSSRTALPPEDGKFIQVMWRQSDRTWKVAADSWNTNTMAAAPAAPAHRP